MRPIKFRGKRVDNGEWVYGSYHYSADGKYHYILALEKFNEREGKEVMLHTAEVNVVDPAALSQFTGLLDKNGNEIWDGDVLLHKHQIDGNFVDFTYENYLVAFNTKYSGFEYYPIINKHVKQWTTRPLGGDEIEIIGNIHDNPELIN